jgi:hypothetical protein
VSFTAARDSSHKSIEQLHSDVSIHSSGVFGRGVRHGVPTAGHYETPRWCPPLPPTGADGKPAHMARAQKGPYYGAYPAAGTVSVARLWPWAVTVPVALHCLRVSVGSSHQEDSEGGG